MISKFRMISREERRTGEVKGTGGGGGWGSWLVLSRNVNGGGGAVLDGRATSPALFLNISMKFRPKSVLKHSCSLMH